MVIFIGMVGLAALLPVITLCDVRLRYPLLWLIAMPLGYAIIARTTASTTEWVKPLVVQFIYPLLIGYICSELIVQRRSHKQPSPSERR
ncbi:MAG: hypothetical protein ABIR37_02870 [Candidatus Saccharimonadales bacterium]